MAPHRQLPPGPRAPDVHVTRVHQLPGEQRPGLRPAPHQRGHRLRPRAGRAALGAGLEPPRGQLPRLLAVDLHPDRQRALQLRRGHAAAQRGLQRRRHVQHLERAQHLQPRGDHGQGGHGRPGGQEDGPGPDAVPPRVRPRRPHDGRPRRGRQGGELGPVDAGRDRTGHRRPPRVQGLRGVRRGDRLHGGDGQPDGQGRLHRPSRDQGGVRGRRRPAHQPARPAGPDDGWDPGRDRPGAELQPAPAGRPLPGGQLGTTRTTRASGTSRSTCR